MICAICEIKTEDMYRCDTCGDEVCEDCIVSEGVTIDDIKMTCVSCIDRRKGDDL